MKKLVVAVAGVVTLSVGSAFADVWQDCTAWYIGGSGTVGAFANGDMTDLRHAADPDSPTHGGTNAGNLAGISNCCETVYSAVSGRTFENQRTIYLAQREIIDESDGKYKVYENDVSLPFNVTNGNYTLLFRVRLDERQPTNKNHVNVADFGYKGGSSDVRYGFCLRYFPENEEIGFMYNNGSNKKYIAPTNDVCTTLRGKWLEISVTLEKQSSGKSRMRFGLTAESLPTTYAYADYQFPAGHEIPENGKFYLVGVTRYGGASTSCAPARGSYHMVSYWERVLTDDEILEAFKLQGPDGTAAQAPALLKVGDSAWSADVFGASIEGASATPSLDLQDLAKIPLKIGAGQTLNLPFAVPATCTNLRQIVRLTAADGSVPGNMQVKIDDVDLGVVAVSPNKTACVDCEASFFTEGAHVLTLTRADAGVDPLKLSVIEISGSWRLGWIDNSYQPFQMDTTSSKTVLTNVVANLLTNDWPAIRGTVKTSRQAAMVVRLSEEDVTTRRIYLRAKPYSMPESIFDCCVLANDEEVYRHTVSSKDKDAEKYALINLAFQPNSLKAGENVFLFKTDNLTSGSSAWYRFDYFELEVGKEPSGSVLLLK